jgi:pyridoxamine 5'-phosphate oxidase
MVLLKGYDDNGFVFFTNYRSRKARELRENPRAALVLHWPELHRQIRVTGRVKKVSPDASDAYFASRPPGSRLAACASPQSEVIESREVLDQRFDALQKRHPDGKVPRPKHWGGYCVYPDEIEFWQSGEHRLHNRILFRRAKSGAWSRERLAP